MTRYRTVFDADQWCLIEDEASVRKARRSQYQGSDGHSTMAQEIANVAAEKSVGIFLGLSESQVDEHLREERLSPGVQWIVKGMRIRVHATDTPRHTHLIEKVKTARKHVTDRYIFALCDTPERTVLLRGWVDGNTLRAAPVRDQSTGIGPSFWIPVSRLFPMSRWGGGPSESVGQQLSLF